MSSKKICILGGTGFVGGHLARDLSRHGHQVKILSRDREDSRDLLVLPSVTIVPGSVYNEAFLSQEFEGQDVVINLVGVLHDSRRKNRGYSRAHVDLPRLVVAACKRAGITRLLHMSALQADPNGPSDYLKSRGEGENLVFADAGNDIQVTAFRPSVIFGPDDSFSNRFVSLLRMSPGFIPLACAKANFQPVYVKDVAQAFTQSLSNPATIGQRYDLVGPTQYTLKEIVSFINTVSGANRKILSFGPGMSKFMAFFLQFAPGKPLTPDNVRSMSVDSTSEQPFPPVFGITPTSFEALSPQWLAPSRDQLDDFRSRPRRGRIDTHIGL